MKITNFILVAHIYWYYPTIIYYAKNVANGVGYIFMLALIKLIKANFKAIVRVFTFIFHAKKTRRNFITRADKYKYWM